MYGTHQCSKPHNVLHVQCNSCTDTGRGSAGSPLNPDHPVSAAVSALLSLSDRTNSRSPSRFTTASPLPRMSYLPLRSSHQLASSFTAATSSESSNTVTHSRVTTTSSSVSYPLATTTRLTSAAGGNGVTCTSSTAQSPNAPAIITTSNSQTSSGVGSGIVSGGTASERSTAVVTESHTPWEDVNYVRVMAVPDAVHCSEDLPEESDTMRLTQEQTVALQKVDGPSLIGTDLNQDVICPTDFTRAASVGSDTSRNQSGGSVGRRSLRSTPTHSLQGQRSYRERSTINEELLHQQPTTTGADPPTDGNSAVATAGPVESLDSRADAIELDSGSPRKQQRRAAAKPGRKTTRQRTANSKRKS